MLYSKAKLASACGGIIYFLSYVPYMYVAIREEVAHDKITAFEKCIAVSPPGETQLGFLALGVAAEALGRSVPVAQRLLLQLGGWGA